MEITDEIAHAFGTLANTNPTITQIKLGKNKISERVMKELSGMQSITFDDISNEFDDQDEKKK